MVPPRGGGILAILNWFVSHWCSAGRLYGPVLIEMVFSLYFCHLSSSLSAKCILLTSGSVHFIAVPEIVHASVSGGDSSTDSAV